MVCPINTVKIGTDSASYTLPNLQCVCNVCKMVKSSLVRPTEPWRWVWNTHCFPSWFCSMNGSLSGLSAPAYPIRSFNLTQGLTTSSLRSTAWQPVVFRHLQLKKKVVLLSTHTWRREIGLPGSFWKVSDLTWQLVDRQALWWKDVFPTWRD